MLDSMTEAEGSRKYYDCEPHRDQSIKDVTGN